MSWPHSPTRCRDGRPGAPVRSPGNTPANARVRSFISITFSCFRHCAGCRWRVRPGNNAATQAVLTIVQDHRLAGCDGSLHLLEFQYQFIIVDFAYDAFLVGLAVPALSRSISNPPSVPNRKPS